MAVQPNAQGIVYAGQQDGHGMSIAYRPRGRGGHIPSPSECERAGDFYYKHTGKNWDLHVSKGKGVCRDRQRDTIYNGHRGWKYLLEIHSLPDEPLDIPPHIIAYHLRDVAHKITDSNACLPKGLVKFLEVLSWIFIIEQMIISIAFTICATIFSFGTLTVLGVGMIMAVVGIATTLFQSFVADIKIAQNLGAQYRVNSFSTALQKINNDIRKRSAQISNMLIYQPSAMFAGGQGYEMGKAGSESFCYAQAYDPNDALLGTAQASEIDELCQNRSQVNLAGGVSFMQNLLGFEFSLARVEIFDMQSEQVRLQNQIKEWNLRINSFISAINKQGFFMAEGGSSIDSAKLQERLINTHIKRRQKNFCTMSMLHALQSYNKGQKYKNPTVMNDFEAKMDTKAKLMQVFDAQYQIFEQSLDRYSTPAHQALDFITFIKTNFAQVNKFKNDDDKKFSVYLGIENYINPKIRHSGDKAFSYEVLRNDKSTSPSYLYTESGGGDTDGGSWEATYKYDIFVYAGGSPKIPPFLLGNPYIIWGWIYKDIDAGRFSGMPKFDIQKTRDTYITCYCAKRSNKYRLAYRKYVSDDSGSG
ncbi:hypothetical protein [Helicobacter sp. T3_23-1059]